MNCETEYCKALHEEPFKQMFEKEHGRKPTASELAKYIFDYYDRIRKEKNGDIERKKEKGE